MSGYSDRKILYKGMSEDEVHQIYSKTLASTASSSPSHLNTCPGSSTQSENQNLQCCVNSINRFLSKKWMPWHHRLKHPSDKVLAPAILFLSKSCTADNSNVHCRHCLC